MKKTNPFIFAHKASKTNSYIAAEIADEIKEVIYKRADKIPLALVIGVLEIVKQEVLAAAD